MCRSTCIKCYHYTGDTDNIGFGLIRECVLSNSAIFHLLKPHQYRPANRRLKRGRDRLQKNVEILELFYKASLRFFLQGMTSCGSAIGDATCPLGGVAGYVEAQKHAKTQSTILVADCYNPLSTIMILEAQIFSVV